MCGCKTKIGSMRKIRSKKVSLTIEDGLAVVGGVLGGMAMNSLAEQYAPASMKESIDKFLPYGQMALGGGLVVAKKAPRAAKMAGFGVGAVGTVTAASRLAPQYFKLGSTETYRVLGTGRTDLSRTPIPVIMGEGGYDDFAMRDEALLGAFSNHSEALADL